MKTLKEVDSIKLPVFVVKELHKIPPITFDHLDVTSILKEMARFRSDVSNLQRNAVQKEELCEIQSEVNLIKNKFE